MSLNRDMWVMGLCDDKPNLIIPWLLMASYVYYHRPEWEAEIMSDYAYDNLFRRLKDQWNSIDHKHKDLITEEDINAGSLYGIAEDKYPQIVKNCAEQVCFDSRQRKDNVQ